MSTKTLTYLGAEWTHRDDRSDWLVSDGPGGATVMREDTLRRAERERQVEAERAETRRKERERAHAELERQPRVTVCGIEWLRHPERPELLVCADDHTHVMSETRVRAIEEQRAREALQEQAQRAASTATLEARLAALEAELTASRTGA